MYDCLSDLTSDLCVDLRFIAKFDRTARGLRDSFCLAKSPLLGLCLVLFVNLCDLLQLTSYQADSVHGHPFELAEHALLRSVVGAGPHTPHAQSVPRQSAAIAAAGVLAAVVRVKHGPFALETLGHDEMLRLPRIRLPTDHRAVLAVLDEPQTQLFLSCRNLLDFRHPDRIVPLG